MLQLRHGKPCFAVLHWPGDGDGRDFAFDVLPSEVISVADVIKGAKASLTEGAIGDRRCDRWIGQSALTPINQQGDYTFVLPSANFVWHFRDDLQLRLGVAKTMARPSVESLAPANTTESVSWGEFTQIYFGNVNLEPYSAHQGDVSLEWYFSPKSILNFAVFYKRINDQMTTSWEPQQDIGVPGYLFNIIRPINGDYAKVHGFEAGMQHFWESGFGVRAQFTRNWSKSWVGGQERPLEGIAPSVYSMSVMYEKGHWSLGTTADHTQGFVTAVNVLGDGYNEEADGITWMTAHISYEVDDHFRFALEGQNLLDAKERYTINGNPRRTISLRIPRYQSRSV